MSDPDPAAPHQPPMCLAEEWQRDGRGLWAMRACQYYTGHGKAHSFGSWRYGVQPPSTTDQLPPPAAPAGAPSAGDALLAAVDCFMQHGPANCVVEPCAVCDVTINQLRLAYKVWTNSRHQHTTPVAAPAGAAVPRETICARVATLLARMRVEAFAECTLAEDVDGALRDCLALLVVPDRAYSLPDACKICGARWSCQHIALLPDAEDPLRAADHDGALRPIRESLSLAVMRYQSAEAKLSDREAALTAAHQRIAELERIIGELRRLGIR